MKASDIFCSFLNNVEALLIAYMHAYMNLSGVYSDSLFPAVNTQHLAAPVIALSSHSDVRSSKRILAQDPQDPLGFSFETLHLL